MPPQPMRTIRLPIGRASLLARPGDRDEPVAEAVAEGFGQLARLADRAVELRPTRLPISSEGWKTPGEVVGRRRLLRSGWRRELHLARASRSGGSARRRGRSRRAWPGLSVKRMPSTTIAAGSRGRAPVEVADDDMEPIELRLVVVVDRAREGAEGAMRVDRADEPRPGPAESPPPVERHRGSA